MDLIDESKFVKMLIHTSAYRFGNAVELTIEAIGETIANDDQVIDFDHLAGAYYC